MELVPDVLLKVCHFGDVGGRQPSETSSVLKWSDVTLHCICSWPRLGVTYSPRRTLKRDGSVKCASTTSSTQELSAKVSLCQVRHQAVDLTEMLSIWSSQFNPIFLSLLFTECKVSIHKSCQPKVGQPDSSPFVLSKVCSCYTTLINAVFLNLGVVAPHSVVWNV